MVYGLSFMVKFWVASGLSLNRPSDCEQLKQIWGEVKFLKNYSPNISNLHNQGPA
jgi:hypothetical protein